MTKARDIASAAPAPSTVSATELGYLDGVTSAIQTQLDAKTAKSTLTTTGDIYYASSANTPARLAIGSTSDVLTVVAGVPGWAAPAGGSTFAGCSIKQSSAQSISNNTDTIINFDSEFFDTDAYHDTSSNNSRITIPAGKGGYYLFTLNVRLNGGTSGDFFIKLIKNGSEEQVIAALLNSVTPSSQYSVIAAGAVSDYFEAKVFQVSGNTQTIEISQTRFQASFLGA
jgi:hypothetical protein